MTERQKQQIIFAAICAGIPVTFNGSTYMLQNCNILISTLNGWVRSDVMIIDLIRGIENISDNECFNYIFLLGIK